MNSNNLILEDLKEKTLQSLRTLKNHFRINEFYYLPIGIILLKWVNDSAKGFLFSYEDITRCERKDEIKNNIKIIGEKIEKSNPAFEGIFTNLCFNNIEYIEDYELKNLIYMYGEFDFSNNDCEKYILGPFIDYYIDTINEVAKAHTGIVITDKAIKQIMARLFNIHENMVIADITCGTGGVLTEVINQCNHDEVNIENMRFFGQEINLKLQLISKVNLIFHGIKEPEIYLQDSLNKINFNEKCKADIILSDLPLGLKWDRKELMHAEELYNIPNQNNAEWIFVQRAIAALKSKGKAIFVVSKGTLIRNNEAKIRYMMLKDDIIEAVISMPGSLYGTKTIPVELLIINKNKSIKNKILFIDASKDYEKKERGKNYLSEYHINKILKKYKYYEEIEGYSKVVDVYEVIKNNCELNSSYYINNNMKQLSGLKMKCLNEVANVQRGLQITKRREYDTSENASHFYIKISDISDNTIKFNDKIGNLSDKEVKKYELQPGDIIISARGILIKCAIFTKKMPKSIFSGNIMLVRVNKNEYDPYFLKYYFESKIGQEILSSIQEGVTITALNPNKFKEMPIPDIDIEIQRELAERIRLNEEKYKERIKMANKVYEDTIKAIDGDINFYMSEL